MERNNTTDKRERELIHSPLPMENLTEIEQDAVEILAEMLGIVRPVNAAADATREKAATLLSDFEIAIERAGQNAVHTITNAAKHCEETVDLYLEYGMCNFDAIYEVVERSAYFENMHFDNVARQLYWKQLLVLDRWLLACPNHLSDISGIRENFVDNCNLLILEKGSFLNSNLSQIAASVSIHRKMEASAMISQFKQIEEEVASMRKEKGPPVSGTILDEIGNRWNNDWFRATNKFETDEELFRTTNDYFSSEFRTAINHCEDLTRLSYEYSQGAIDRAIDVDVAVFDEFTTWTSSIVENAVKQTENIFRAIGEKLSHKVKGDTMRGIYKEYNISDCESTMKDFTEHLRKSPELLRGYRYEDRVKSTKRFELSIREYDDEMIENLKFLSNDCEITVSDDLDLAEFKLTKIGKGGQGTVFSFVLTGRKVVAKRYQNEKDRRKEVGNLCKVGRHDNVLNMLCRGHLGSEHFLILEYCPKSLADELRTRHPAPLAKKDFITWIRQLAEGMLHLHGISLGHGAQLYHGDLKPDNILIGENGNVKICDFGISELLMDCAGFDGNRPWRGTLRYMAPELHQGKVDRKDLKKADVWSWGIVVWEMFANRRPHDSLDDARIIKLIAEEKMHPPLPSGTIESLDILLKRCWQGNVKSRPTFNQILNDIVDVIGDINDLDDDDWEQQTSTWRRA